MLVFSLGVALAVGALASPSASPKATPGPKSVTRIDGEVVIPGEAPFADGETLTYGVSWMGISGGDVVSTVKTGEIFDGKPAIHLTAVAKSNRTFSMIHSINDASESWIDPDAYFSIGWRSDQHEGKEVDKQTWIMDYANGVAHRNRVVSQKNGTLKTYDLDFPLTMSNVQDAHSMGYFYRVFPLKVGQALESDVFTDKKVWKLHVDAVAAERIKTAAGSFDCIELKPVVSHDGVPEKKGAARVWITDDERRIPVKVELSTPFGKVKMELKSFSAPATK